MINSVPVLAIDSNNRLYVSDSTPTVELYAGDESFPYFTGAKIADGVYAGDGIWNIDVEVSIIGTVVVDGVALKGWINVLLNGDDIPYLAEDY